MEVYLEHVRVLLETRKQISWKSQKLVYDNKSYL